MGGAAEAVAAAGARRLILPLPPSDNRSHVVTHRRDGTPKRVRSRATRDYETEAGWLSREWMLKTGWRPPAEGVKVVMRFWVFWPSTQIADAGNRIKILADSVKAILFPDDCTLLPRAMDYQVDRRRPRVEVEFEIGPR